MKISVIIPAYNEEKYIGKCLDSIMQQQMKPDEVILVDNNSTDKTVEIAKNYPIRIVHEKKQGITHSRNRGYNEAKYEIIARTDADTVVPPDWIKIIKKNFLDESLVALSGPAEFNDLPEFAENSYWQTKKTWINFIKAYGKIVKKVLKHDCLYGPNCTIRKSAWEKIKNNVCLDDSIVHEDLDLAIHIAPLGKIKFDNSFIVSTSIRRWKKPESYLEYLIRVIKSIQKHEKSSSKINVKQMIKNIALKVFGKIPLSERYMFDDLLKKLK